MTLITHISTEEIQLVIADSLCDIPAVRRQIFDYQKIHNFKTFIIAKYGNYPHVIENFLFEEEEKQRIKTVGEFLVALREVIDKNRDEGITNLLLQQINEQPHICSISKNEIVAKDFIEAGKNPDVPTWVFFSPVRDSDGNIDLEYQSRLSEHLDTVIRVNGIESHEDLKEEILEDFVKGFMNPITSKSNVELMHGTIGGEKIWYAYSIDGGNWKFRRIDLTTIGPAPVSDVENLEQLSELLLKKNRQ